MPFPPHALVALCGTWTGTDAAQEVWQFGVRIVDGGDGTGYLDDCQDYIDTIQGDIAAWFAAAGSLMSSTAQLDQLKVNNIKPDGTYLDPVTHEHSYPAGLIGAGTQKMDGISSLAYSWVTPNRRGPAHRGRSYPPNPTYSLVGNFSVATSDATAAAGAGVALLTLLNQDSPSDTAPLPVVVSQLDGGVFTQITGCEVGTRYDSQRRRANRVVETYERVDFP